MLHGRHPVQAGPFQIRDPEPRRKRERVPLVSLAPAEDRRVGREAEGLVACLHRAGDEFLRHGAVPVDVQLEPPRSVGRRGDFLQGFRRDRARDVLEFEEIRELEAHAGRDGLPPLIRCSAVNQAIGIARIHSRYDGCSAFLRSRFWRQTATWYRSDERRFMYRSSSGFSVSRFESETTRRSARRATVRAQWSRVRDSEPRGRMNSVILPTSNASIASSRRATWTDVIWGTLVPADDRVIASSAPTVKRSS